MKPDDILNYCISNLEGTVLVESWGEKGIFYNPFKTLKRGVYVLTIKEKDGDNDKSSNLNRDNTFRVNLGIRKKTFEGLFGEIPKRPSAGDIVDMNYDFAEVDKIIPHPVYAWMGWISVLNPSIETFETLKTFIEEAYGYSKEKFSKRK
ncbi:DUF6194 family protein [Acetobacterium wieringae]|uniref:DUF6194 family protein n=1 Tax=Acetobacterium wieringae TaxID=52694 RepID=UPI0026E98EA6|nr:DUF6194 family protein [Acetobacterium wieringae]